MSRLVLTVLIFVACLTANAQQKDPASILNNENLRLKDSTGRMLDYKEWRPLVSSGEYSIRSVYTAKDTVHTLHHLTAEEKARIPGMRNSNAAVLTQPQQPTVTLGPQPSPAEAFPIGYKLNMLTTRDMDGKKVDNKMAEGKIVVINFWFVGCPPCRAEIPELNKLVAEHASDPDIIFLAVGLDEAGDIRDFIKDHPFNYRQVASARRFCDAYGVTRYPTNVIIDKKGTIQYSSIGFSTNYIEWMRKTIEVIKNEK
ncbi:TlpA family protein disulfide reductase [Mucilaginibacter lutimaris]|uniref:TlpA family protein disulfide reductase n=1 Tax=Mucilaginibacter lutimaris TaxID=931629 RepID=A0ABW2ZIZ9_9SPHI